MPGSRTVVSRSNARALVVAGASSRAALISTLQNLNFVCAEVDDPYVALAELCRRPLAYRAVVLSLAGFYREELSLVRTIKQRFPHVDVWLTHSDGRHASLAEAMRLGADGLLADDGLHRTAEAESKPTVVDQKPSPAEVKPTADVRGMAGGHYSGVSNGHAQHPGQTVDAAERKTRESDDAVDADFVFGEPVLTADELRALLQEQPMSSGDDSA